MAGCHWANSKGKAKKNEDSKGKASISAAVKRELKAIKDAEEKSTEDNEKLKAFIMSCINESTKTVKFATPPETTAVSSATSVEPNVLQRIMKKARTNTRE